MVDIKAKQLFQLWYGSVWRIDMMWNIKGPYVDIYFVNRGINNATYDKTFEAENTAEVILIAIDYLQNEKKAGFQEMILETSNLKVVIPL